MSGGRSIGKVRVTTYYASLLLGVCWGPVTALRGVWIGEKLMLGTLATSSMLFNINQERLHGGIKKEGGASGGIWFMRGTRKQKLPRLLARKLYGGGVLSALFDPLFYDKAPGYRNICCIGLTEYGGADSGYPAAGGSILNYAGETTLAAATFGGFSTAAAPAEGFYVGANNPYLKSIWVEVLRASDGWYPSRSLIYRAAADRAAYLSGTPVGSIRGHADSNFVHILYEIFTNTEWGMGAPPWMMDDSAWRAAALTAFNEALGGSFLWREQMKIADIAQMVADHVRAMIFADPRTGLLSIKLLRPDYVEADVPVLDPDNSDITEVSSRDANEVVNEIIVKWTNPATDEEESTYAQDLASIADVGGSITETHVYAAFRRQDLADAAASRDVFTKTAPLKTVTLTLPPSAPTARPGDVYRLRYPEEELNDIFVRVVKASRGGTTASSQELKCVQDIFAELPAIQGDRSAASGTPQSRTVLPARAAQVITLPYFTIKQAGLAYRDGDEYGGILVAVDQSGAFGAEAWATRTTSVATVYEETADVAISRQGTLESALPYAATSVNVTLLLEGYGSPIDAGDFVAIGATPASAELCLITAVTASGLTLRRGVLDTVPGAWALGTTVWVLRGGATINDRRGRAAGAAVNYGIRPNTFYGALPAASETHATGTLATRAEAPLRPADVRINGGAFAGAAAPVAVAASFDISWANRNRLTEDELVLQWDDSTVTLEAGQTTRVEVRNAGGNLVVNASGLTGTSYTAILPGAGTYTVTVYSFRDGISSFQKVQRQVYL